PVPPRIRPEANAASTLARPKRPNRRAGTAVAMAVRCWDARWGSRGWWPSARRRSAAGVRSSGSFIALVSVGLPAEDTGELVEGPVLEGLHRADPPPGDTGHRV